MVMESLFLSLTLFLPPILEASLLANMYNIFGSPCLPGEQFATTKGLWEDPVLKSESYGLPSLLKLLICVVLLSPFVLNPFVDFYLSCISPQYMAGSFLFLICSDNFCLLMGVDIVGFRVIIIRLTYALWW